MPCWIHIVSAWSVAMQNTVGNIKDIGKIVACRILWYYTCWRALLLFCMANPCHTVESALHFNVEDKLCHVLTSLQQSYFNAGFYWNPLDGKSPDSFNDLFLRVYGEV